MPSLAGSLADVAPPRSTISLGKYGSFPTNLIIQRPYHLTYELLDKQPNENFNSAPNCTASRALRRHPLFRRGPLDFEEVTPAPDADGADNAPPSGVEYSLVDSDSGAVVATTDRAEIDASARQTLTLREIEP